jgi:hypothetical protein
MHCFLTGYSLMQLNENYVGFLQHWLILFRFEDVAGSVVVPPCTGFDVLTAVVMRSSVFWEIQPTFQRMLLPLSSGLKQEIHIKLVASNGLHPRRRNPWHSSLVDGNQLLGEYAALFLGDMGSNSSSPNIIKFVNDLQSKYPKSWTIHSIQWAWVYMWGSQLPQ